jgi:protein-S-isoprenylcysteine O-methyltransferase Ste14
MRATVISLLFYSENKSFLYKNEIRVFDLASSLIFFEEILFVIWVAFWAFWFILAYRTRSPVKHRQSSLFPILPIIAIVIWILITTVFPGLLFLRFVPDEIIIELAGILIMLVGLGFAIWARLHLGTNWSGQPVIRMDHKLVRTGPYRIVRNPIYTGILVAFAGTALVIGELWAVVVMIILLIAFFAKIRMEEKFLLEEFGESYIQYKKEVKALIPFVL